MLQDWIPDGKKPALQLKVTNASPKDQAFLRTLIALFTDPANQPFLDQIRTGNLAVQYNPQNGAAHLIDLEIDAPSPGAGEMVNFFAAFTKEEWEILKPSQVQIKGHLLRSEASAKRLVSQLLGYEWMPKPRAIVQG